MMYYTYDPIRFLYTGAREPQFEGERIAYATSVAPPAPQPQTLLLWQETEQQWVYQEWYPTPGCRNIMEDVLTYTDLRILEYPSLTEYVDGIAKGDEEQVQTYLATCREVKAKWPKDMAPLTRKEYLCHKLGMRTLADYQDPLHMDTPIHDP